MYCRGLVQTIIADRLGVTQATVSNDLTALRREWQRQMAEDYERLRAEEYAKLADIERDAIGGWLRSRRDAVKRTEKVEPSGPAGETGLSPDGAATPPTAPDVPTEVTTVTEGQAGDPRFLQIRLNCHERRCKLIGADDSPGSQAPPITIIRIEVPAQQHQRPEPVTVVDALSDGIRIRTEGDAP